MNDFKNWKEVSRGFFRYIVAASVCYEIHIIKHTLGENLGDALANLYLVGDWYDKDGGRYFERELLCGDKPVKELLVFAGKDFKENMK